MEDTDMEPRSGVPFGHYVIALFIAAIAGGSLFAWQSKKVTESASAVLDFNSTVAERADPALVQAGKPAIVLANSILDDDAIAALAKQSSQSSQPDTSQVGEFRSSLELTEPSVSVLMVRFVDRDSDRAAANANAVAQALAQWMPSSQPTAPAADAEPQPAAPPPAAPAQTTTVENQSPAKRAVSTPPVPHHPLSDSLGELRTQLSATNRDLDGIAEETDARGSAHSNPQAAYREFRQQQLLKTRVNAAEKKLDDLRTQVGEGNSDHGVKGRLTSIQQALGSILRGGGPAGHSVGPDGFTAAGTSASQLLRERTALTHAISVVDQERQAIEQTEIAQSSSPATSPAPSSTASPSPSASNGSSQGSSPAALPSASAPPSTAQSSPSPQQPPASADSSSPALQQPAGHPLSMMRLASPTPPPPLWPPILAGCVCGLLYMGGAALAYRRSGRSEDYEAETSRPKRFITLADPANEHDKAADLAAVQTELPWIETVPRRRAPFAFDDDPEDTVTSPSRRAAFFRNEEGYVSVATREEPVVEKPVLKPALDRAAEEKSAEKVAGREVEPTSHKEEVKPVSREEEVEAVDPFAEQLKKSLSETEIGRMFERGQDPSSASFTGNSDETRRL